jgi:DNA-binding response OmpR family regulator
MSEPDGPFRPAPLPTRTEKGPSPTVLIVELDPPLAELERIILEDGGYHAIATVCGPDSLQTVRSINPDAVVLDLGPHSRSCGWHLLEELRVNPNTQGIPLVVISDTEQLLTQAKLNFNVQQEMIKPYDISELVRSVQATLAGTPLLPHPAPSPTTGPISVQAAWAISQQSGRIMTEWLRRVQQKKVLGPRSSVPPRVLIENISAWLVGLVSALRYGPGYLGTAEIQAKLAGHIREAEAHQVTLPDIIQQFEILRDGLWEDLKNDRSLANLTAQDVFDLAQVVNVALDAVLAQVAETYVSRPGEGSNAAG